MMCIWLEWCDALLCVDGILYNELPLTPTHNWLFDIFEIFVFGVILFILLSLVINVAVDTFDKCG